MVVLFLIFLIIGQNSKQFFRLRDYKAPKNQFASGLRASFPSYGPDCRVIRVLRLMITQ